MNKKMMKMIEEEGAIVKIYDDTGDELDSFEDEYLNNKTIAELAKKYEEYTDEVMEVIVYVPVYKLTKKITITTESAIDSAID